MCNADAKSSVLFHGMQILQCERIWRATQREHQSLALTSIDSNAGPAVNGTGTTYDSFTFHVQDNRGTANGGIDVDPTARTTTISVT